VRDKGVGREEGKVGVSGRKIEARTATRGRRGGGEGGAGGGGRVEEVKE